MGIKTTIEEFKEQLKEINEDMKHVLLFAKGKSFGVALIGIADVKQKIETIRQTYENIGNHLYNFEKGIEKLRREITEDQKKSKGNTT